jgi:hypothetical protein
MNPIARTQGVIFKTNESDVIASLEGKNVTLTHALHQILTLCDGNRDIDAIAHMLDMPRQDIFAALDQLADLGLLQTRTAPPANVLAQTLPAGMNRREALSRIALGVAGGLTAFSLGSRVAFAQDADKSTKTTKTDTTETNKPIKGTTEEDKKLEEEIAALDKRIQERDLKRKKAIQCRKKGGTRAQEEEIKRSACQTPGQHQNEIAADRQLKKKKKRLQEQRRKSASEHMYKTR